MTPAAPRYLDLRMFPNRSLRPEHFRWLMLAVAAVSALGALRFLVLGAWPVALFFLLDAGLLYLAFKLSYRSADSFEEVRIDEARLTVRRVERRKPERLWEFHPHWVRVLLERRSAHDQRLALASHGDRLEIGRFLSPEERAEVAAEIKAGLDRRNAAFGP
jgi:uncharacterized membrane protein